MVEGEPGLAAEAVRRRRVRLDADDDVLDADAELAVLVVARLVGDDVAGREGDFGADRAGADADGALVDVLSRVSEAVEI